MAAAQATDDGDATRVTATRATDRDRDLDLRPIRPATDDGGDEVVRGGGQSKQLRLREA